MKQFIQSRKIWIFFGIVDILLAGIFLSLSLRKNDKIITINSGSSIDYTVHLNKNSFYETDVLPGNMEYIASLIKDIDTNLTYKINSSDALDYDYSYSIEAITRVYGDKSQDNILFEKKETLQKEKTVSDRDKKESMIKENIKIDYGKYNELISLFKSSYLLESNSDVHVILHVKATLSDQSIKEKTSFNEDVAIVIPLTEQTVNIKMSEQPAGLYKVIESSNKIINSYPRFIVSILLFCVALLSFAMYVFDLGGIDKASNAYRKTLKKILRDYDLIIVNLKDRFDECNYKVIEVTSFDELKDVHDNIGNPILFKEIHKFEESVFLINENDTLYKYVLKK